jgi:ferredoxin-type protein NapH
VLELAKNKNRWKIQALSTFIANANLTGFSTGKIYKGSLKSICVPGLNCYSCPGAVGSCPIGSLQGVIGSSKFKFSYYIVGTLILFGVLLGRFVCGFLCPFGWFQELLHKIPLKKFSTKNLKLLTYLKYVILVLFVIVLPMVIVNEVAMGDPWFCKRICPVGILEGAIPLAIADSGIRSALGWLFTWKSCILIGIVTLSVFFYRPFCKWFCPLGAFYALFNKLSFYGYTIDKSKCTNCWTCAKVCKMDVEVYKTPNNSECIRCGNCISNCNYNAICKSINFKKGNKKNEIEKTY